MFTLLALLACSGRVNTASETPPSAPSPSAEPVVFDAPPAEPGLVVELYEADPAAAAAGASLARPTAAPLGDEAVQALLSRVPALEGADGDRKNFALRPGSKPPPLPGSDVQVAFPPPERPDVGDAGRAGPVEVVRFAPEGDVPMAPHLSVTFNQPMIAVTSQDQASKTVPVVLKPDGLPGRWRWLGTRTLMFDGDAEGGRLPMATAYTVEVPAGTKSAAGTTLAEAVRFQFSTPPIDLVDSWPDPSDPQDARPTVALRFDQRVDPSAVAEVLKITGGSGSHAFRVASAEEIAAASGPAWLDEGDGRTVVLVPTEPLPLATSFAVEVPAGTPSAEGPLRTTAAQAAGFHTYGPLRVSSHHCWYQEPCPPTTPLVVELTNPLDPAAFDPASIRIAPPVPGLAVHASGSQLQLTGPLVGRTTYTVTVPAELQDKWGQTLGTDASVEFRVGPADKTLSAGGETMAVLDPSGPPALSVWSTNHPALRVTVHRVTPDDWGAWMTWTRRFWYEDARPGKLPGKLVWAGTVQTADVKDRSVETKIDLKPYLEGEYGQFVVAVEPTAQPRERWNRQYVHRWVQVTDLGLVGFSDATQLVGWATDLATGAPAPGVALSLQGTKVAGTTGADGLASLALSEQAGAVLVARRGADLAILPRAITPWDESGWVRFDAPDRLGWYVADDRGLYRPGEQARIKGWLRRVTPGPTGDVGPLQGDRARIAWKLTGPMGNDMGKGEVPVTGLGGFSIDVDLPADSNLGTAQLELTALDAGSAVDAQRWHPIRIEEFRRPEFEVSAEADADRALLGERRRVELSASYFAGGALPNAEVRWNVFAAPASYAPPGWTDFSFGTWSPWWWWGAAPVGERHVGSFAGTTDGGGHHRLGMHFRATNPARPWTVRAEGTAIDVNRQGWTAEATVLLHPADTYVGLRTDKAFVDHGEPVRVDAVIVDVEGKAVGRAAEIRFAEMVWKQGPNGVWAERESDDAETCTAQAADDGKASCTFTPPRGGSYRVLATVRDAAGRPNETELRMWVTGGENPPSREIALERVTLVPETAEVTPGQTARILVQSPFFPAEGVLTVRREGLASTTRFSMAGPSTTLEVPIREAHVPNVTLQVDLVGSAPRLDDAGKATETRRAAHATGSLDLQIPKGSRTLAVAVAPKATRVSPGDQTEIALTVTGPGGAPVAGAELAVVVADESVLALTGYRLPDPMEVFYVARGAGVSDHRTRAWLALADPTAVAAGLGATGTGEGGGGAMPMGGAFADDESERSIAEPSAVPMAPAESRELVTLAKRKDASAADKAEMKAPARGRAGPTSGLAQQAQPQIAVRTDLSALALFAPNVRTDAEGKATVPVKLPDSLTRYRVMVVAADPNHAFGTGDAAITARLPLMVRPSAPRFLNFGDQLELPVVLQNQTDVPMSVEVAARATNLQFVDAVTPTLPDLPDVAVSSAGRRVTVPANDRVEVRFPAATLMAGTARLQVVAASGPASDAATLSLPVWTPATTEAFATYGSVTGKGVVQPVQAPPDSWPQFGGLDVTTSSTQLQALTDAVLYLQQYPFECNEQLSSRVLAIAALRDVLEAFEAPGLPPKDELEAQVASDLERLAARQHWNGGFAFWRKGDEPWPFLSVHVANAFARARAKGFDVPDDAWNRSLQHLRDIRSYLPHWYSDEAKWFLRAYALDVRRRMGDADPGAARALYREAGTELGIDGLAFLLPTLHEANATAEVDAILRHLGNQVTESSGTAHFVTSYSDGAQVLLHSDRRADGIVLEALMSLDGAPPKGKRDDELIEKVVRGLLAHRTKGRWGNTQENAFVLLALDRYFHVYEAETPDFVARIWLGEGYAGDHTFRGRTTERAHLEIPMGQLTESRGPVPLTLVRDGDAGRLYYRIGLRYAPRSLDLQPADYGFAVERVYQAVDDPGDVRRDADGTWRIRAGARIKVTVTLVTPMRRNHVALIDPLPAGLEAENPSLATTGTLPADPADTSAGRYWWWSRTWWEHDQLRDERVEAFTSLLWDGVYEYSYQARATTPGRFVVPPAKAEEMYMPETFGRSATDRVIVE